MSERPLLKLDQVSVYYGDLCAVRDITLEVRKGEIVSLIGANGAGKSTILNTIMGLTHPKTGSIEFDGRRIERLETHDIIPLGLALVPEGRRIFPELSVLENLLAGSYTRRARQNKQQMLKRVFELFPILEERKNQLASTLSGGEQQMLAIGRALMTDPKMILFDEISLGLSPIITLKIYETIKKIRSEGVTVLLVEQNVRQSLAVADRAYVLKAGRIVLSGETKDLRDEEEVRKAYFGA
ncbi:MAG: ABC transporter ATP-binding protein [Thaumarchaeota archaeon]|jgi:branched-chain amino acid transport system ATP-binding protein|nr:ABC transporter ATP-binding protein [Nitrososphaerota archaeon]